MKSCKYILFFKYLLTITALGSSFHSYAQKTYPVSATINIVPPYSPYLSDYVAPGADKLVMGLLLNDPNVPLYNVRLQITIEGVGIKIQTHPDFRPQAISLESGFQERISSEDLLPYFDPNHLVFQGISKEQYQKNAALPDGLYKFCVQAFDIQRNVDLSNIACATAWFTLSEPPLLISPTCESKVTVIYPQNIIFQWQTRNASPNSFSNTEYNFRLVQIMPEGNNPNQAMNSMPPIFETTTDQNSIHYGLTETQLVPGQQYAWRVQAKDKSGRDLFKNSGFSQVCSFTYGNACKEPQNIKVIGEAPDRVDISWDNSPGSTKYLVSYRLKGFDSPSDWYQNEILVNRTVLSGLKPGNKYEYKIESVCNAASVSSLIDTFSTSALTLNNDCGKTFVISPLDNLTGLAVLNTNDALTVDGFTVRVSEASGGNGIFSGRGIAYIPFLNTYIRMSFNDIGVNQKYQVVSGNIVADKANLSKYVTIKNVASNNFCAPVNSNNILDKSVNTSNAGSISSGTINKNENKTSDTTKEVVSNDHQSTIKNITPITGDSKLKKDTIVTTSIKPPKETTSNQPNESNKIAYMNAVDSINPGRIAGVDQILYIVGNKSDKRWVNFNIGNAIKNKDFGSKEIKWQTHFDIDDPTSLRDTCHAGGIYKQKFIRWPHMPDGFRTSLTTAVLNNVSKGIKVCLVKEFPIKKTLPIIACEDGKCLNTVSKTFENIIKTYQKIKDILDYFNKGKLKKPDDKSNLKDKLDVQIIRDYKNVEYKTSPFYYREKQVSEKFAIGKELELIGPGFSWPVHFKVAYLEPYLKLTLGMDGTVTQFSRQDIGKTIYVDIPDSTKIVATVNGDVKGGVRGGIDLFAINVEFRGEGGSKIGGSYTYYPNGIMGNRNVITIGLLDDVTIAVIAKGEVKIGVYELNGEEILLKWVALKKEDNFIEDIKY